MDVRPNREDYLFIISGKHLEELVKVRLRPQLLKALKVVGTGKYVILNDILLIRVILYVGIDPLNHCGSHLRLILIIRKRVHTVK